MVFRTRRKHANALYGLERDGRQRGPDAITAVLSPCRFPGAVHGGPTASLTRSRRSSRRVFFPLSFIFRSVVIRRRLRHAESDGSTSCFSDPVLCNQSPTGGSRKQRPYLIPSATYHRSKKRNGLLVLPALAMNGDLNREAASLVHSPKKKADV
ncbi:hypothetical protein BHM03_00041569 [Ensete ventricosum]|uniref:Uncharacterized protein n=1 Tax=Ensete ventricosum TaxID=4639 RepID=A0A445MKB0_ENSVE|nr:hypothetical protein BHM03_00041569 [Ensete ventricosum]